MCKIDFLKIHVILLVFLLELIIVEIAAFSKKNHFLKLLKS